MLSLGYQFDIRGVQYMKSDDFALVCGNAEGRATLITRLSKQEALAIKKAAELDCRSVNSWVRFVLAKSALEALKQASSSQSVVIGGIGNKIVKVEPDESIIKQRRDKSGKFIKKDNY